MARSEINKQGIARMMRDIQKEFDKHPVKIPVEADENDVRATAHRPPATTTIYNGPVIMGNADGAQLAWGNQTANQAMSQGDRIAPGFEALAQAVVSTMDGLDAVGLPDRDLEDAKAAGRDLLAEVTKTSPDRSFLRRAVVTLKGCLSSIALGLVSGTAQGAEEWAKTAVEQLGAAAGLS